MWSTNASSSSSFLWEPLTHCWQRGGALACASSWGGAVVSSPPVNLFRQVMDPLFTTRCHRRDKTTTRTKQQTNTTTYYNNNNNNHNHNDNDNDNDNNNDDNNNNNNDDNNNDTKHNRSGRCTISGCFNLKYNLPQLVQVLHTVYYVTRCNECNRFMTWLCCHIKAMICSTLPKTSTQHQGTYCLHHKRHALTLSSNLNFIHTSHASPHRLPEGPVRLREKLFALHFEELWKNKNNSPNMKTLKKHETLGQ